MFDQRLIHIILIVLFHPVRIGCSTLTRSSVNISEADGDFKTTITTANPLSILLSTIKTTSSINLLPLKQKNEQQKVFPKLLFQMINASAKYSSQINQTNSEPYLMINSKNLDPERSNKQSNNNQHIPLNRIAKWQDCIDGKTYWNNVTGQCQQCTAKCPSGAMVSRPCNRTSNLECICAKGSYLSLADGTCKPCSECPSGYGVWRTCKWTRNTVCRQCQPGTFSGVSFGILGCITCTKCGPNQEMISACDGNRDTLCIDRSKLTDPYMNSVDEDEKDNGEDGMLDERSSKGKQEQQFQQQTNFHNEANSNFDRITKPISYSNSFGGLSIAMLVAIVFTFCIYALFQLRCATNHALMINNSHSHNHHSHLAHRMSIDHFSTSPISKTKQPKLVNFIPQNNAAYNKVNNANNQKQNSAFGNNAKLCPHQQKQQQVLYNVPSWVQPAPPGADIIPYQQQQQSYLDSLMPIAYLEHNNNKSYTRKFRTSGYHHCNHYKKNNLQKTHCELLLGPSKNSSACKNETESMIESVPLISDDVQHLTIDIRQSLEYLLGKDNKNWRLLAKELGYDEKHIAQFESKATTISNGLTFINTFRVVRLLLLDWFSQMTMAPDESKASVNKSNQNSDTNNDSGPPSLATLTNALIRIGRVDCARVVVRQNYHQQRLHQESSNLI